MTRHSIARREALASGAGLLGMLTAPRTLAAPGTLTADPRLSALGQVKMEAALDQTAAIWAYKGMIYAVEPQTKPRLILRLEGGSAFWGRPQDDGSWKMLGATMSFFCDPQNGDILESYANPYTGSHDPVRVNLFAGGGMRYPADGSAPHFEGVSTAGESTPGGFKEANPARPIGLLGWTETQDNIMMTTDHAFEVPVQPQLEARTIYADKRGFLDPAVRQLPARMATSTITPWLRWMDMGDAPGHLVWHCWGEKRFDLEGLPPAYLAKAGKDIDLFRQPPEG